jgi:DNA-directed RNA polymerase beta' subunit
MNITDSTDRVVFDVLSAEEIESMSTCEITSSKLSGDGTVYDKRMGVVSNDETCIVCDNNMEGCTGHFGFIRFVKMISHPLFHKHILNYLKCVCHHCHRFILTEDVMRLCRLLDYDDAERFDHILEYVSKDMICIHCNQNQPKYIFNKYESSIYMFYRDVDHKLIIQPEDIYNIFIDITPEDIKLMGLPTGIKPSNLIIKNLPVIPPTSRPYIISDGKTCDDDLTYKYIEIVKINNKLKKANLKETKRNQFITSLEFHVKTMYDNTKGKSKQTNGREMKCFKKRICGKNGQIRKNLSGKRCDFNARTVITGDPTLSMEEMGVPIIMSKNLTIPENVNFLNINKMTKLMSEGKINKVIRDGESHNMKYALHGRTMYQDPIEGKWIPTTIIETDEIKRNGKIYIPYRIELQKGLKFELLEGDILIRNLREYQLRLPKIKYFPIKVGDVVERHLRTGDYVLLNRQPTLHLGSMMAFRIILMEGKTFKLPLAITTSFNADFDGDEMNIHVPQSYEAQVELMELCAVRCNMISPQANNPNIVIIQDGLLGSYLVTRPGCILGRDLFFQCSMAITPSEESIDIHDHLEYIHRIQTEYNGGKTRCWCNIRKHKRIDNWDFDGVCECMYSGHNLISLTLPKDLHYTKENGADGNEEEFIIYKGVVVRGAMNKAILGGSQSSLLLYLHHEYNTDIIVNFIDNISRVAYDYLLHRGFSVGLSDMIAKKTSYIQDSIKTQFFAAKSIMETIKDPGLKEIKINMCLNKGKDIGQRIAKETLTSRNNLKSMVVAGSKGNYINISQIIGTIGQQTISGQRIMKTRSGGTRTLPHYRKHLEGIAKHDPTPENVTEMFESRGFVTSSYIKGLNPKEFFFHAFGGREGLVDTAMKTAETGYIQRRIIKKLEDCKIQYDGSVQTAQNKIIQFSYGGDGLDPSLTMKMSGYKNPQICDIARLVNKLQTNEDYKLESDGDDVN